eukprot:TRINITY_DN33350_c0_g1_i4.p2 TRINITY_DN33350_c0_g1~~TRINITY_DN33350_c0_g1_i4.p2  ORF type:complete len:320 (+),score=53.75 TRINITY_DN33350_c0_g1_i4:631-1590(+)
MLEGLLGQQSQCPAPAATDVSGGRRALGWMGALADEEALARRAVADEAANALLSALAAALHCGAELQSAQRAELRTARVQAEAARAELNRAGQLLQVEREAARMPRAEQDARMDIMDQEADAVQKLQGEARESSAAVSASAQVLAGSTADPQASAGDISQASRRGHITKVIHIHAVSHRIAEYCPLEWAQVCSTMGRMVYVVSRHWYSCWTQVINFCHRMQCVQPTLWCPEIAPALIARNELSSLAFHINLSIDRSDLRGAERRRALIRRVEACQIIFHDYAIRFGDIYAELVPFHMSLHVFLHHLHNSLQRQASREAG